MDTQSHSIETLFEQLGLDSTDEAIEKFITQHSPLAGNIELQDASFWNASQAAFLRQSKEEDADWAELVDQLDAMLR